MDSKDFFRASLLGGFVGLIRCVCDPFCSQTKMTFQQLQFFFHVFFFVVFKLGGVVIFFL